MSVIPDKKNEQIEFAEQHAPVWSAAAASIGLTTPQCTAIAAAAVTARKSYNDALAARQAAKAATQQSDTDLAALHTLVADAIKGIRLYAESNNDPGVYAKANIPAPSGPTAALPPTQPIELRAALGATGAVTIEWKAGSAGPGFDASTSGVLYTIRRRLSGQSGWTIVGTAKASRAGKRGFASFVDGSLPANPQGLQYIVQGVRTVARGQDLVGPSSDVFNITLGIGGDGSVFIQNAGTESGNSAIKMAA